MDTLKADTAWNSSVNFGDDAASVRSSRYCTRKLTPVVRCSRSLLVVEESRSRTILVFDGHFY